MVCLAAAHSGYQGDQNQGFRLEEGSARETEGESLPCVSNRAPAMFFSSEAAQRLLPKLSPALCRRSKRWPWWSDGRPTGSRWRHQHHLQQDSGGTRLRRRVAAAAAPPSAPAHRRRMQEARLYRTAAAATTPAALGADLFDFWFQQLFILPFLLPTISIDVHRNARAAGSRPPPPCNAYGGCCYCRTHSTSRRRCRGSSVFATTAHCSRALRGDAEGLESSIGRHDDGGGDGERGSLRSGGPGGHAEDAESRICAGQRGSRDDVSLCSSSKQTHRSQSRRL